jgi:hypothetical protein
VLLARRPRTYRRREPEHSALYQTLQQHLETFLATAAAGDPLPRFVERELRAFLKCGILAHGFARVHCGTCGFDRLVAFSCKGRGFCPSCGGKRMARLAEHLVDHVIPPVPLRQWVLTLPYRLRYRAAYDAAFARELLATFARCLHASYRRRAREAGIASGRTGAVTFLQRFGSALNLNPHFHTQSLDGVFTEQADGSVRFHPLPPPTDAEVHAVLEDLVCRLRAVLQRHGLLEEDAFDELGDEAPFLAGCYAGSVVQRNAIGPRAGRGPARLGASPEPAFIEKHLRHHAQLDGFDLHASVSVGARDHARREQLLRYCARPPISHDRLELHPDGRIQLQLKTPWHDGTTHLLLHPDELIQRLVALIPRPHKNLVVYHGVLAPNAKWRSRVVAYGRGAEDAAVHRTGGKGDSPNRPNSEWARLMRRAFDLDVLRCPRCGSTMRVIALIESEPVARRILRHIGLRDHAPPIAPAQTPDLDFHVA